MSRLFDNQIVIFLCFLAFIMVGVLGLICGIQWLRLTYVENVEVIVKVDNKIVYAGTSGCVDVESSGANTTVSITGGFLCFFPKAYYVSNDVDLIGVKP